MNADAVIAASRLLSTAVLLKLEGLVPRGDGRVPFDLSRVSPSWLTRALQPLAPGSRVRDFKFLDRNSGTTTRARIALQYDDQGRGERPPDTAFLKIAPRAFAQRLFTAALRLGRNEVAFYRTVRPGLPVRAPAVWACASSGSGRRFVLLLEDLVAKQARFTVVGDRADPALARRVMQELARLHAAFWESPRFTGDLAWVPCRENRTVSDRAVESFVTRQMVGVALRRFGKEMPAEFRRAGGLCMNRRDALDALWARGPRTLLHGDCHVGNLFFERDGVGFLDWQVVYRAPAMRDVTYFLCLSCPSDVRRRHERELIENYLEELARQGVRALAFDAAWEQYRQFALYGWLAATFTAAAGGGLQAREISLAGLRRTTRAIVELESVAAVERELES